ncbi:MAG: hypothetical protein K8S15_04945 [Candidatus Aegiribacteria sp.]|nr:hypothetical protein [Candidatus Aegiribacteria sp.]
MPRNKSVIIWGDGAVGKGLAVALSGYLDIFLAGPAGSGRGTIEIQTIGAIHGNAVIEKVESGDHIHCDHCILALKAYDLKYAAEAVMKSTDGRCICLTNGMGLEEEWGESWEERVEPAVLTAGFHLLDKNLVETAEGDLIVSSEGRAEELFSRSSLHVVPTEDMETVRWSKWLTNSVINPLGALSGLRNNQLLKAGLGAVVDSLFTELARVIPADLRDAAVVQAEEILGFLLESSSNRCSMLQDITAGRRTEIDFLTGLHEKRLRVKCPAAASVTGLVRARASQPSG